MTLIDTGPLVAALAVRDENHILVTELLRSLPFPLETTEACVAEAMYFLGRVGGAAAQTSLLDMRLSGELRVAGITPQQIVRMHQLLTRYADVPMDYADDTLVVTAETFGYRSVFTFDSDFRIYRVQDGSALEMIPQ